MSITDQMQTAIEAELPGSIVEVTGAGGHFEIHVTSALFEGKRLLQKQRMVFAAITHLMGGDDAPVHAIDRMVCSLPE